MSVFLSFVLGILYRTEAQKATQQYDTTAEVGVSDEEYGGPAERGGAAPWALWPLQPGAESPHHGAPLGEQNTNWEIQRPWQGAAGGLGDHRGPPGHQIRFWCQRKAGWEAQPTALMEL